MTGDAPTGETPPISLHRQSGDASNERGGIVPKNASRVKASIDAAQPVNPFNRQ